MGVGLAVGGADCVAGGMVGYFAFGGGDIGGGSGVSTAGANPASGVSGHASRRMLKSGVGVRRDDYDQQMGGFVWPDALSGGCACRSPSAAK